MQSVPSVFGGLETGKRATLTSASLSKVGDTQTDTLSDLGRVRSDKNQTRWETRVQLAQRKGCARNTWPGKPPSLATLKGRVTKPQPGDPARQPLRSSKRLQTMNKLIKVLGSPTADSVRLGFKEILRFHVPGLKEDG